MEFADFKKVWDAHGGAKKAAFIIFDNSGRWILNERYYEPFKDPETGQVIPNDPRGYGDFKPVDEYVTLNESLGTIERKMYPRGFTAQDRYDRPNDYFVEVRHVENIQAMWFAPEGNDTIRPYFDHNIT